MLHDLSAIKKFRKKLLSWYQQNKRDLPFRKTKDPYKIWLSEIMLQQTTVKAVVSYYLKFIKKYPELTDVANAKESDLLALWQGLGYYSRIRNFQTACRQVVDDFKGCVPQDYNDLLKLKGVGTYTAAAIASICFDEPVAVVDGNVKRVIARLHCYKKDVRETAAVKYFQDVAQGFLDRNEPGDFNQAMMELGATVCTPKNPQCSKCPVALFCLAKDSQPELIPPKNKRQYVDKKYKTYLIHNGKEVLLCEPHPESMIKNMWELPLEKSYKDFCQTMLKSLAKIKSRKIGEIKHSITRYKITTSIYELRLTNVELTKSPWSGFKLLDAKKLKSIPVNTLSRKIIDQWFVA